MRNRSGMQLGLTIPNSTSGLVRRTALQLTVCEVYWWPATCKIHNAAAVQRWLRQHPRLVLLFLPTYCPRANPIERCFGDLHHKVVRNHRRKRMRDFNPLRAPAPHPEWPWKNHQCMAMRYIG